jgi:EAL domain-containing protein (putative c-di-GMP-specific phosphodiesterase class I)
MGSSLDGLRVAVVDDDPLMRDLLERALAQLGVVVVGTADDGHSALELLEAEPIDVLLCDLNMPGMDGIELLRHLAARSGAPALAMISGDDHILRIAADLGQAHRLRVLGTIPKPATPDALRSVLERLDNANAAPSSRSGDPIAMLDVDDILAMIPGALELHYQPQIELATGLPVSLEALARLRHPTAGLLGPGLFVPLAEQRGVSFSLTRVVVRRALEQLGAWLEAGLDLRVAVNVSADDLVDVSVVGRLEAAAVENGVPLTAVTLELTESRIVPEATGPLEVLSRMRMKGVGLSIDDYGTGFSSLQQLRRIPFHELKIDQSFVANATTDDRARTMLESTIQLAAELGLSTVAEGVETAEQLELVTALGCDIAQGYFLAPPMPVETVTPWLEERLPSA